MRLAALLCLLAAPAFAQSMESEREKLKDVRSEMSKAREGARDAAKQADDAQAQIAKATQSMIDLARRIQDREDRLTRTEFQMKLLDEQRRDKLARLTRQQKDVVNLLAAIQMMERRPPQMLLLRPAAAVDTARSGMLLSAVIPSLQERTAVLRASINDLNAVRGELEAERNRFRSELDGMTRDRRQLEQLRRVREQERQSLLSEAETEADRFDRLAREARDIRDLLGRLEGEARKRNQLARLPGPRLRPDLTPQPAPGLPSAPPAAATPSPPPAVAAAPPPQRSITAAQGALPLPVRGELVQSYGDRTINGPARGILIRPRGGAQVIAPYGGRVVFAGPFRAYGMLLIIEHGEGYHSLLAGFERIDAKVGATVEGGEPVGVMGAVSGQDLYIELRRGNEPVNPLPWLVAGLRKTQG